MSLVKLFGVPSIAGCRTETSEAVDQHRAPKTIRAALERMMQGFDIERHFDDLGDLNFEDTVPGALDAVRDAIIRVRKESGIPLVLGGAHTITLGSLRGIHQTDPGYSLIYIDAHPDLMPRADINYGSALYHAIEEGVVDARRMVLLGIRKIERPEQKVIDDHHLLYFNPLDFESHGVEEILETIEEQLPPPYFISLDLDAIDPTYAPGVTSPTPLGLNVRETLFLVNELCKRPLVGLEIMELSPVRDRHDDTARIAASFLQTLSNTIAEHHQPS